MKARITKREWQARGGLANPNLFRKASGKSWTYWIIL